MTRLVSVRHRLSFVGGVCRAVPIRSHDNVKRVSMSDSVTLTIPRVRVLTGHVDPDTAHLVDDHPYGGLRCQRRCWVETRVIKKTGLTEQRFVAQTTHPKRPGTVWNKPKPETFAAFVVMYLDDLDHVARHEISYYGLDGEADTRTRHMGVYEALSEAERERYDQLFTRSRQLNPTVWGGWSTKVELLADFIAETGDNPALQNDVWTAPDRRLHYLSDPAAYVIAARELIAARSA